MSVNMYPFFYLSMSLEFRKTWDDYKHCARFFEKSKSEHIKIETLKSESRQI